MSTQEATKGTYPIQQKKLFDFMWGKGDVPILDLYRHLYDKEPKKGPVSETRDAQQRLGPTITRLNRRLKPHRLKVVPGEMKGTYTIKKA